MRNDATGKIESGQVLGETASPYGRQTIDPKNSTDCASVNAIDYGFRSRSSKSRRNNDGRNVGHSELPPLNAKPASLRRTLRVGNGIKIGPELE